MGRVVQRVVRNKVPLGAPETMAQESDLSSINWLGTHNRDYVPSTVWVLSRPAEFLYEQRLRRGPRVNRSYPRSLECLTTHNVITRGAISPHCFNFFFKKTYRRTAGHKDISSIF